MGGNYKPCTKRKDSKGEPDNWRLWSGWTVWRQGASRIGAPKHNIDFLQFPLSTS